MIKKRMLSLCLTAIFLLIPFAGCSGQQAPATEEPGAAAPEDSVVDAQEPYPAGTFRYMAAGLPQFKKTFYDSFLARQGERGEHVTVEYEVADAATIQQQMILGFTSGAYEDLPDVIFIGPTEIAMFQKNNMLQDITDFMAPLKDQMVDGALDGVSYGDRIYAYPDEVRPQLLYYNTEIFDEYGIDIDRCDTVEGWLDVGRELKEQSGGTVFLSNYDPGKNTWRYYGRRGFLPQAGGRIWDDEGNVVFGSDAGTVRAMGTLAALKEEELITAAPWMQPACFDAMRQNQIATFYIGAFYDEHMRKNVPDDAGKWRVRPAPVYADIGLRGAPVSSGVAVVNKPDLQYDGLYRDIWMDYNFNFEERKNYVNIMIEEAGPYSNTIIKEALQDPFWQQASDFYGGQSFMQAEFEGLENAAPPLITTNADADADAIISPEIEKFLAGEQTMEQAIANADQQLKQQVGKAEL